MKDFAELKELVNVWGKDKDLDQAGIISETAMDEVVDGIGDMLVTIIILSEMLGLEPETCLSVAYDEIKGRKGKMIDGMFVKEKA